MWQCDLVEAHSVAWHSLCYYGTLTVVRQSLRSDVGEGYKDKVLSDIDKIEGTCI